MSNERLEKLSIGRQKFKKIQEKRRNSKTSHSPLEEDDSDLLTKVIHLLTSVSFQYTEELKELIDEKENKISHLEMEQEKHLKMIEECNSDRQSKDNKDSAITLLKLQIKDYQALEQELNKQQQEREKINLNLKNELESKLIELSSINEEKIAMDSTLNELNNKLKLLETSKDDSADSIINEKNIEIEGLNKQLNTLTVEYTSRIDDLESLNVENTEIIADLEDKLELKERETFELKQQHQNELESMQIEHTTRVDKLIEELKITGTEDNSLVIDSLMSQIKEYEQLHSDYTTITSNFDQKQQDLINFQNKKQDQLLAHKNQIVSELQALQQDIKNKKHDLDSIKQFTEGKEAVEVTESAFQNAQSLQHSSTQHHSLTQSIHTQHQPIINDASIQHQPMSTDAQVQHTQPQVSLQFLLKLQFILKQFDMPLHFKESINYTPHSNDISITVPVDLITKIESQTHINFTNYVNILSNLSNTLKTLPNTNTSTPYTYNIILDKIKCQQLLIDHQKSIKLQNSLITDLNTKLKTSNQLNTTLTSELQDLDQNNVYLAEQIQSLTNEHQQLELELEAIQITLQHSTEDYEMNMEIHNELEQHINRLNNQIATLQESKSEKSDFNKKLVDQLQEIDTVYTNCINQLQQYPIELGDNIIQDTQVYLKQLQDTLAVIETDISSLVYQINELQVTKDNHTQVIDDLSSKLNELQQYEVELKEKQNEYTILVQQLTRAIDEQQIEYMEHYGQLKSTESRGDVLELLQLIMEEDLIVQSQLPNCQDYLQEKRELLGQVIEKMEKTDQLEQVLNQTLLENKKMSIAIQKMDDLEDTIVKQQDKYKELIIRMGKGDAYRKPYLKELYFRKDLQFQKHYLKRQVMMMTRQLEIMGVQQEHRIINKFKSCVYVVIGIRRLQQKRL